MLSRPRNWFASATSLLLLVLAGPPSVRAQPFTLSVSPGSGGASLSNGTLSMTANASGAASPILNLAGVTLSGNAGTGNDTGWRLLAIPSTGATRGDLGDDLNMTVTSGSVLYSHDGTDFVAVTDDATVLSNGRGFLLYVFDDATETVGTGGLALDAPGSPPSADVAVSGLATANQWHLLGNPFDVSFDLSSLNLTAQGFQATVQIWDPGTASWSAVTQEVGTGDVITAWQGFFVERTTLNEGQESLTFDYAGRTTGGTLIGGKRGGVDRVSLGLNLAGEDSLGMELARDVSARLYFAPGAHAGWDAFDATKQEPPLSAGEFALLTFPAERDGKTVDLVQRSHQLVWSGYEVFPLGVRTRGSFHQYRVSWAADEIPFDWDVWLEDSRSGTRTDMRVASEYLLDGEVGDGRLQIVIRAGATVGNGEEVVSDTWTLHPAHPNPFNRTTSIGLESPGSFRVRLDVYDVLGRRVAALHDGLVDAGRHEFRLDGSNLPAGLFFYVLRTPDRRLVKSVLHTR